MNSREWASPNPWECPACPAKGLGGKPALDQHTLDYHTIPAAGIVPDGVDARAVRAWGRENGWPNLGTQGRLPQPLITAYSARLLSRLVTYLRHYSPPKETPHA